MPFEPSDLDSPHMRLTSVASGRSLRWTVAALGFCTMTASCENDAQEPITPPSIEFNAPDGLQPADSTLRLTLHANATGNFYPRVIIFRTGGGSFFPGGAETATVPLDDDEARVTLRPPVQAGVVMVTATAGSTTAVDSIRFSTAVLEPLIASFDVSRESAPADGLSTITAEAHLSPRGARTVSKVIFRTTAGHFTNGQDNIEVGLDGAGVARTTLTAPDSAETGEVVISAGSEHISRAVAFVPPPPALRNIAVAPDSAPADGATVITMTVTRDSAAVHVRDVVLEASVGSFVPGNNVRDTARFDGHGNATGLVRVPDEPGLLLLRAIRPAETIVRDVTLVPALPDQIQISGPAQYDPGSGEAVTITSTLFRLIGSPSSGLPVLMDARTLDGDSIGIWLTSTLSDANDRATATWMATDSTFHGTVLIRTRTLSAAGDTISATYPLRVMRP